MSITTSGFSTMNGRLGAAQTDVFSLYTLKLPVTETSLTMFATPIDLPAGEAETHNVRRFEKIPLTNSLQPISRSLLNDSRIADVTGSIIPIRTEVYGTQIIVDNKTEVNTKENIMASCMMLLADFDARLTETILFNLLKASGISYTFSHGGTVATAPNLADLISCKIILNNNGTHRAVETLEWRATNQIDTHPKGKSFVGHVSIAGRGAWEMAITDPKEMITPFEMAGRTDYLYNEFAYFKRADICLYSSSEMIDSPTDRKLIVHGAQSYIMTGKTPLSSKVSIAPAYLSAFGMHSIVSNRRVLGVAVGRNETIVNATYTDGK